MNIENKNKISCFNAYDVRGRVPESLNPELAYKIARAYAIYLKPKKVVIGHDIRLTSPVISENIISGLIDEGIDVLDVGLSGTEIIYFANSYLKTDGGIMITASHNPKEYNGIKFTRENSKPISQKTGLLEIKKIAETLKNETIKYKKGAYKKIDITDDYIKFILEFIDIDSLKPLKILTNPGNGCAGPFIDKLEKYLPFKFVKMNNEPDGNFPNGIPNPMIEGTRESTSRAVVENKCDLAVAWDGDFDRCFFYDENGEFIEGYYIVGLLAESLLKKHPKEKIIHDPRVIWNTLDIVNKAAGITVMCKSGHTFIKEKMRDENALYGGEMSAHHYFRNFFYCDSGMIPWLLIAEIISKSGKKISEFVKERKIMFPISGEINVKVTDADKVIENIKNHFSSSMLSIDLTDGISLDMGEWRFNIRKSNTEPLLRLNIETRSDEFLLQEKTKLLLSMMK